jgi:hypothetical protein
MTEDVHWTRIDALHRGRGEVMTGFSPADVDCLRRLAAYLYREITCGSGPLHGKQLRRAKQLRVALGVVVNLGDELETKGTLPPGLFDTGEGP